MKFDEEATEISEKEATRMFEIKQSFETSEGSLTTEDGRRNGENDDFFDRKNGHEIFALEGGSTPSKTMEEHTESLQPSENKMTVNFSLTALDYAPVLLVN